jgi:hypothetical protein
MDPWKYWRIPVVIGGSEPYETCTNQIKSVYPLEPSRTDDLPNCLGRMVAGGVRIGLTDQIFPGPDFFFKRDHWVIIDCGHIMQMSIIDAIIPPLLLLPRAGSAIFLGIEKRRKRIVKYYSQIQMVLLHILY